MRCHVLTRCFWHACLQSFHVFFFLPPPPRPHLCAVRMDDYVYIWISPRAYALRLHLAFKWLCWEEFAFARDALTFFNSLLGSRVKVTPKSINWKLWLNKEVSVQLGWTIFHRGLNRQDEMPAATWGLEESYRTKERVAGKWLIPGKNSNTLLHWATICRLCPKRLLN